MSPEEVAQNIALEVLGRGIQLTDPLQLYESDFTGLIRFAVAEQNGAPFPFVVLKYTRCQVPLFDEWAALQLVTEAGLGAEMAPRFIGGDKRVGALLIEYDEGLKPYGKLLHDEAVPAASAVRALVDVQRARGRLHQATSGLEARYSSLRAGLPNGRPSRHGIHAALPRLESLATLWGRGIQLEVDEAMRVVAEPGDWMALTQGSDATPANAAWDDGQVRLYDFECAAMRHALVDGSRSTVGYLTSSWAARVPEPVRWQMFDAYLEASGLDALPNRALHLTACSAMWMAIQLGALEPCQSADRQRGYVTDRQRILAILEHFSVLTERVGELTKLGRAAATMRGQLASTWGVEPMPLYPALAG